MLLLLHHLSLVKTATHSLTTRHPIGKKNPHPSLLSAITPPLSPSAASLYASAHPAKSLCLSLPPSLAYFKNPFLNLKHTLLIAASGLTGLAGLGLDVKDDQESDGDEGAEEHGQVSREGHLGRKEGGNEEGGRGGREVNKEQRDG